MASSYSINEQAWLREPIDQGKAIWTDPYFDEGGGSIWMRTRSYPIFNSTSGSENDDIVAVATTDIRVEAPQTSSSGTTAIIIIIMLGVVLLLWFNNDKQKYCIGENPKHHKYGENVIIKGWLARESTVVERLLNRRFAVLTPSVFATFRKETDDAPSKVWSVTKDVIVTPVKGEEYHLRKPGTSTFWAVASGAYDKYKCGDFV
eukprot:jgi/Picre1/34215/NNA_001689.t1